MSIYNRAQSASQMLRAQPISLLGIGQPAKLSDRPDIPQVSVGNVGFLQAKQNERAVQADQQSQIMGSLLQLGIIGAGELGAYQRGAGGYASPTAGSSFGGQSFSTDPGYLLSYQGYPQRF
jgi:hypothetical protein